MDIDQAPFEFFSRLDGLGGLWGCARKTCAALGLVAFVLGNGGGRGSMRGVESMVGSASRRPHGAYPHAPYSRGTSFRPPSFRIRDSTYGIGFVVSFFHCASAFRGGRRLSDCDLYFFLHAFENQHDIFHVGRGGSRRCSAADRLERSAWDFGRTGVVSFFDPVSMADPAFFGDRMALSGRLRESGFRFSAGSRRRRARHRPHGVSLHAGFDSGGAFAGAFENGGVFLRRFSALSFRLLRLGGVHFRQAPKRNIRAPSFFMVDRLRFLSFPWVVMGSSTVNDGLLQAVGLSWRYGERGALCDFSLCLSQGEWLALMGPNGSGKSTALKMLSTFFPIPPEKIFAFGRDVALQLHLYRRCIGMVFQSPALDPHLTVLENLYCYAGLFGMDAPSARKKALNLLEQAGLFERRNEYVRSLSGGLQRRVELTKVLLTDPKILFLDEPAVGLDPAARQAFWEQLEKRKKEVTIVFTTHDPEEAEHADRVCFLNEGKNAGEKPPSEWKKLLGERVIRLQGLKHPQDFLLLKERFPEAKETSDGWWFWETSRVEEDLQTLFAAFGRKIIALQIQEPTLADVFFKMTGRSLFSDSKGQEAR